MKMKIIIALDRSQSCKEFNGKIDWSFIIKRLKEIGVETKEWKENAELIKIIKGVASAVIIISDGDEIENIKDGILRIGKIISCLHIPGSQDNFGVLEKIAERSKGNIESIKEESLSNTNHIYQVLLNFIDGILPKSEEKSGSVPTKSEEKVETKENRLDTQYDKFLSTVISLWEKDKIPEEKEKQNKIKEEALRHLNPVFAQDRNLKEIKEEKIKEIGHKLSSLYTLKETSKGIILISSLRYSPITVINVTPVGAPLEGVIGDILTSTCNEYIKRAYYFIKRENGRYKLDLHFPIPIREQKEECVLVTPILFKNMLQPAINEISKAWKIKEIIGIIGEKVKHISGIPTKILLEPN